MRRRRQKNTLLPKMLGLAVLINAILLPILAQFGVFKSIGRGQRLTPIELVKAPPPEKRPAQPKKAKKQVAKAKPAPKAAPRAAQARRAPSGPPPVRVVAAGGPPGGGGGGDAGITSTDGGVPAPPAPNPGGAGETPPTPAPAPVTPPTPTPTPAPPPVPTPTPAPPPVPHVPVLTAAAPVAQPRPAIPDELRDADLNAAFEGLFTVRADGTATVKMVSSTGNPALDGLALDAARRWTFRPATRDGQPVESYLRLRVEFDVSS